MEGDFPEKIIGKTPNIIFYSPNMVRIGMFLDAILFELSSEGSFSHFF